MKTKALPCPFCGQQPRFSYIPDHQVKPELPKGFYSLTCHRKNNLCPAHAGAHGDTKAEAIANWNTRDTGRPGESNFRDAAGRTFQPISLDQDGVARFKKNAIVDFLHENGGFDMNALARMDFTDEDRAQFAQLIGYSTSGFGELSYVALHVAHVADDIADRLDAKAAKAVRITAQQRKALQTAATPTGCDVVSPVLARTLRDLHAKHPQLFTILRDRPADSAGTKPYFGVMLTQAGRAVLAAKKKGAA